MSYGQIVVDVRGAVTWIRLNRPDSLNALTSRMSDEMVDVVSSVAADDAVRCLVVTGEGRGFSAGQDLKEFDAVADLDIERHLERAYHRLIPALVDLPKPVVAAVNGIAAGAGLSLALACDIRIASDAAAFLQAFVRIGLVPDSGGTWLLPRAVGYAKALELSMTGERIDAAEALRIGLVHRVVPADDLEKEITTFADGLAAMPTTAIGLLKRLLRDAAGLTLEEALAREAAAQSEAAGSHDFVEGVAAFIEKRPPDFTGR